MSTAGLPNSYFHALASTSRDSLSKVEPRHAFCPRFVAFVQQSHGFSAKSDEGSVCEGSAQSGAVFLGLWFSSLESCDSSTG